MINEQNFKQAIQEYAREKYGKRMRDFFGQFHKEFPYSNPELDDELYFRDFIDWLVLEKPLPDTGKTITEEFVEAHSELDAGMKEKILRIKGNVVHSAFSVAAKNGLRVKLRDMKSDKVYNVVLWSDNAQIRTGVIIKGRIHPFGDYFRFAGIVSMGMPSLITPDMIREVYDNDMISRAEKQILHNNSTMTSIFNKYPSQWVDGMCKALSIDARGKKDDKTKMIAYTLQEKLAPVLEKIPQKSKDALKLILRKGGFVKYGALKDYDDDMPFLWSSEPPESDIGVLRLYGLLAVGKMPDSGKMYRVAQVPYELREKMAGLIGK